MGVTCPSAMTSPHPAATEWPLSKSPGEALRDPAPAGPVSEGPLRHRVVSAGFGTRQLQDGALEADALGQFHVDLATPLRREGGRAPCAEGFQDAHLQLLSDPHAHSFFMPASSPGTCGSAMTQGKGNSQLLSSTMCHCDCDSQGNPIHQDPTKATARLLLQ